MSIKKYPLTKRCGCLYSGLQHRPARPGRGKPEEAGLLLSGILFSFDTMDLGK
jgi:hypothetical protein